HHAHADPDIHAAGDHRLLGLARALGVEDVERESVLLEDAAALAELRHRGVPQRALADRDLERLLRRKLAGCHGTQDGSGKKADDARLSHEILPADANATALRPSWVPARPGAAPRVAAAVRRLAFLPVENFVSLPIDNHPLRHYSYAIPAHARAPS